jgi:hypothetical protein
MHYAEMTFPCGGQMRKRGQYLLPRGPNMHWLAVRVGEWFSSMLQRGQLFAWKPTQKCRFVRLMIGSNAKL